MAGYIVIAVVIALAIGYVFSRFQSRNERAAVERARREIGKALERPNLPLAEIAVEINSINELASNLHSKNITLQTNLAEAKERLQELELTAEQRRTAAMIDCLNDAARAAEALPNDADFQLVSQTLDLVSGLRRCADALSALPAGPAFAAELASLLEKGELDSALTASAVLEKYFSERTAWREVRVALRSADALLVALLGTIGVHIIEVPILSIVGRNDLRGASVSDRRGLRAISIVQQRAARIARDLAPSELLVVDCHRPGWTSDRLGVRAPAVAIFDPASWT